MSVKAVGRRSGMKLIPGQVLCGDYILGDILWWQGLRPLKGGRCPIHITNLCHFKKISIFCHLF